MALKSSKTIYICSECGYISQKWLGKCPNCASWGTFEEEVNSEENSEKFNIYMFMFDFTPA